MERRTLQLAIAGVCTVAFGACGGGDRQDKGEPEGNFKVDATAKFPAKQTIGKASELVITVENAESGKTVPNIAVTVRGFQQRLDNPQLADPGRPVFVMNAEPIDVGGLPESRELSPKGGATAYTGTWALGPLQSGRKKTFRWSVTAVRPGPYKITYAVAAGLGGKAKAVGTDGEAPTGEFKGKILHRVPDVSVGEDGQTVVTR